MSEATGSIWERTPATEVTALPNKKPLSSAMARSDNLLHGFWVQSSRRLIASPHWDCRRVDWSRRKVHTPDSDEANEPGTRDLHHPANVSTPVYLKRQDLTGFMPYETPTPPKKPRCDLGSRIGMRLDLFGFSFRFAG